MPALIDDFERDDRRSSIDTLRVDTPDVMTPQMFERLEVQGNRLRGGLRSGGRTSRVRCRRSSFACLCLFLSFLLGRRGCGCDALFG